MTKNNSLTPPSYSSQFGAGGVPLPSGSTPGSPNLGLPGLSSNDIYQSNTTNASAQVTIFGNKKGQDPLHLSTIFGKTTNGTFSSVAEQLLKIKSPQQQTLIRQLLYGAGFLTNVTTDWNTVIKSALPLALGAAAASGENLSQVMQNQILSLGRIALDPKGVWQLTGQAVPSTATYVQITDATQVAQAFDTVAHNITGGALPVNIKAGFVNWFHNNQVNAGANHIATKGLAQGSGSIGGLSASLQNMMSTFANDPTMAAEYWIKTNDPVDYGRYQGVNAAQSLQAIDSSQGQRSLAPDLGVTNATA